MNDKIEVPTMRVPPIKKICMTIGQLPASYVESMSYYEMLVWFIHYLRDDIIPVVNANGEATQELQELFVELQNYVNNYFDNLDVQDEIDHKLDEMVEDGTLENILNNYTQLTKVYNTYTDMIADTGLVDDQKVKTLGYYAINDGGSAYYYITDTADENAIQFETGTTGLYATLIVENNTLYSKQFGLKGDGETDETTALQSFYDYNPNYTKVLSEGTYLISDTLYIKGIWRQTTGHNGLVQFDFNNASFKYTGEEDGYSIVFYTIYKNSIKNLTITKDSVKNRTAIIGGWFTHIDNIIVDNFEITNDSAILDGRSSSAVSNEYLDFDNCTIGRGLEFNSLAASFTNAIHFTNCNISGANEKTSVVTIKGARHNQAITFTNCDISYATSSYFNIVDTQTGRGNITCINCYFDTGIKMYEGNNPNGMQFTFIGNMLASGSQVDKTLINVDENMLQNVILGGQTLHGFSLPTLNMNLAKNGNFESSTEISSYQHCIISQSSANWTKEWVESNKNINNRARKITSLTDTSNARHQILCGTTAPYTSEYTAFARFKILQMAEGGTDISMAVNGNYMKYDKADLEVGKEYILINNKNITYNAGDTFTINIYFSDPTDLIIEYYEIGIIPGKMYIPNAPLHATAKLS